MENTYEIPAGFYPRLPECVTGESAAGHHYHVGATSGTGIDGHIGHVFLAVGPREFPRLQRHLDIVRDQHCHTAEAWKAWCLSRGFLVPWRYFGEPLHPMARA